MRGRHAISESSYGALALPPVVLPLDGGATPPVGGRDRATLGILLVGGGVRDADRAEALLRGAPGAGGFGVTFDVTRAGGLGEAVDGASSGFDAVVIHPSLPETGLLETVVHVVRAATSSPSSWRASRTWPRPPPSPGASFPRWPSPWRSGTGRSR